MMANLEQSLRAHPRAVFVLYHNPLLEHVLSENAGISGNCTRRISMRCTEPRVIQIKKITDQVF